jgi:hypothetical protein
MRINTNNHYVKTIRSHRQPQMQHFHTPLSCSCNYYYFCINYYYFSHQSHSSCVDYFVIFASLTIQVLLTSFVFICTFFFVTFKLQHQMVIILIFVSHTHPLSMVKVTFVCRTFSYKYTKTKMRIR